MTVSCSDAANDESVRVAVAGITTTLAVAVTVGANVARLSDALSTVTITVTEGAKGVSDKLVLAGASNVRS